MRPELAPRFVQSAFVPDRVRQRAVRPVLAGIRALIVASAMCLAPVVCGSSAQAQDASETRAGLIRIEWPGGTLEEFVKAVQATSAQPAVNVVLVADDAARGSVQSVRIPPMSVRDVAPTTLFWSLVYMAPTGCEILVKVTEGATDDSGRATEPIITIRARQTATAAESALQDERSVDVIDLGGYLRPDGTDIKNGPAKERLELLLDAVGAALKFAGATNTEFRIHEPTGLLMVKGTDAELGLVRRVVDQIVARAGGN